MISRSGNTLTDRERSKLLLQMVLALTLMIGLEVYGNIENLQWLFVDATPYHQTFGKVLSSKIEAGGTYGGLRFNIVYSYKVGNDEFISNRVHFGYQATADGSYAESYVKKYPVGKEVIVYYDEGNPKNSVLEPQVKWNGLLELNIVMILIPIILFCLAIYFFVRSRRQSGLTFTK